MPPLPKNVDYAIKSPCDLYSRNKGKKTPPPLQNDKNLTERKKVGTTSIPSNIDKGGAHKKRKPVGTDDLFGGRHDPHDAMKGLKREFTFPPFSVLNAREGLWMARKRLWQALGAKGENKRGVTMAKAAQHLGGDVAQSLSLWDPVLCELMVKWFCAPGGMVLDPFCGYSIGGVVASCCGRRFTGIDLSEAQVVENREVGERVCGANEFPPVWLHGNSAKVKSIVPGDFEASLLFSCPPYSHLELYSEDHADLSTMDYIGFVEVYRKIIRRCVSLLKPNAFAVWVVGEVRTTTKGRPYYGFVQDTITAFRDAGMDYYNDMILLTSVGSLPLRTRQAFISARKVGKCHQQILVFVKGDPKLASAFPVGEAAT